MSKEEGNISEEALQKLAVAVEGLVEDELGYGAYGIIYPVVVNGRRCIAKKIHKVLVQQPSGADSHQFRRFKEECITLSRLRHPNLVEFIGIHFGKNKHDLSLIMERLHTDLADFAEKGQQKNISLLLQIFEDVSKGLLYLHSQKPPLIHRDLTASNILLTEELRAKIADLGCSKYLDPNSTAKLTVNPGNLYYMPPEARHRNPEYTSKLDVFSFGNMVLHVLIGKVPSIHDPPLNNRDTIRMVEQGKFELLRRDEAVEEMGRNHPFYSLIEECLRDNADQRPTAHQLTERLADMLQKQQELNTKFLKACKNGDLKKATFYLMNGADSEYTDEENGGTGLFWACHLDDDLEIVLTLIKAGAKLDSLTKHGESPLWTASFHGHSFIVDHLLKAGASVDLAKNDDSTPLIVAAQNGHESVIELLKNKGANIHHRDKQGYTALHYACKQGYVGIAKLLADSGANVDAQAEAGDTPLWVACYNGHCNLAKTLISAGANLELEKNDGSTPMIVASYKGHLSVISVLIDAKANTQHIDNSGSTALHAACQNGHEDVVQILMDNGCQVNAKTNFKMTPLMCASYSGNIAVVRLLLAGGADASQKNEEGKTAYDEAASQGHKEICHLLSTKN